MILSPLLWKKEGIEQPEDNKKIQNVLEKPLEEWNVDEVSQWALKIDGIKKEDAEAFRKQRVTGRALLELDEVKLERCGIPIGPASILAKEINKLKELKQDVVPVIKVHISEERQRFLSSPSLDQIYLPHNSGRFFNYSGPSKFEKHYCIPSFLRSDNLKFDRIWGLIQQEKYFVLHEQRQSGKTTFMLDLRDKINTTDGMKALYINIEAGQQAWNDIESGIDSFLDEISIQLRETFNWSILLTKKFKHVSKTKRIEEVLSYISKTFFQQGQNFVLLIDEIDSLVGDTLLTVLRQIRSGYERRPHSFPASIILIGVRDVRDYQIFSDEQKRYVIGGSAFNISAESCRVPRFQKAHTYALGKQHTENTKQIFEGDSIDIIQDVTDGQPWCVNRIFYEATQLVKDQKLPITPSIIQTAVNNVILSRDSHLINMKSILKETRVRDVIEPILTGGIIEDNAHAEYVEDLGLIKRDSDGKYTISNSIYSEVIPRELCNVEWLNTELSYIKPFYFFQDGTIDMDRFISAWIQFFHENADMWKDRNKNDYHEAWPHLLFFAFAQRIVNGGGRVRREYALGSDACDVLIEVPYNDGKMIQIEIVELKRRRQHKDMTLTNLLSQKWLPQLAKYLRAKGLVKGFLFIFDQSAQEVQIPQEHKLEYDGKKFTTMVYFFK